MGSDGHSPSQRTRENLFLACIFDSKIMTKTTRKKISALE
jgi:hypothetical protein